MRVESVVGVIVSWGAELTELWLILAPMAIVCPPNCTDSVPCGMNDRISWGTSWASVEGQDLSNHQSGGQDLLWKLAWTMATSVPEAVVD